MGHFEDEWVTAPQSDGWRDILPRVLDCTHTHHPPNSYWAVPGRLLAGEYPGDRQAASTRQKLQTYLDTGVDAFLDLTEESELRPYLEDLEAIARASGKAVHYKRLPIKDVQIPDSPQEMKDILLTIGQWLRDGRTVYVHCWGGVGRTGTVVGCHLVDQGMPGTAVLRHLAVLWTRMGADKRLRRPVSPETNEQRDYVLQWHRTAAMESV